MIKYVFSLVFLCIGFNIQAQTWQELINLTQENYEKNEWQTSLSFSKKALKKAEKEFGKNHENYAVSLNNLAFLHHKLNEFEQAIALYKEAISLTEKNLGKTHSSYGLSVYNLARVHENKADYDNALILYFEALFCIKKSLGVQSSAYQNIYENLMNMYPKIDTYQNKKDFYIKAVHLTENNFGELDASYRYLIDKLGDIYYNEKDYKKAQATYLIGRNVVEQQTSKFTEDYYYFSNKIIATLEIDNQIKEAIEEAKDVLENCQNNLYAYHFYNGVFHNQLARLYITNNNFKLALSHAEMSLDNVVLTFGKEHREYLISVITTARVYEKLGKYEKALEFDLNALNLGKKLFTEVEIAELNGNIAGVYYHLDAYENSKMNYEEALKILEKNNLQNSLLYGNYVSNLALIYQTIGQYNKALDYYLIAEKIIIENEGKENLSYAIHLENKASLYQFALMYDEAINHYNEAIEISSKILGKNNLSYAWGLNNLSSVYKEKGDIEKALNYINQSLKIYEETENTELINYYLFLQNKAVILESLNKKNEAITLYETILKKLDQSNFKNQKTKKIILTNLLNLYNKEKNVSKVKELLPIVLEINKNDLLNNFSFLSEKEKIELSNSLQTNLNLIKSICIDNRDLLEFNQYLYNIELFTKEIILQSGMQMRQQILNSNNPIAIEKLDEWLYYKNYLYDAYQNSDEINSDEINSIENYINQLEVELSKIDTLFQSSNTIKIATWQEVQKKLNPNEAAIEFTKITSYNDELKTENNSYFALVLKQDEDPILLPLFEQKQLDSILNHKTEKDLYINSMYRGSKATGTNLKNDKKIFEILWKPIENELTNVSKIYFAPTHTLHQIAFAALSNSNKKLLMEQYDLVQLSSTGQIIMLNDSSIHLDEIYLFGGMDFNLNTNQDSSSEWEYLPGTLAEVENINTLYKKHTAKSYLFTNKKATEENFKKIANNKSPAIIHIATHGFFFENLKKNENSTKKVNEIFFESNENPLFRSGILFSGANANWKNKIVPQNKEDGILTAFEVTNCNLHNIDLVVLSACETGLGEINGSEGVFGLQRAFKAAGVKNLIMSLWEVPDVETSEFMMTFYDQLKKTTNIETSFRQTQKYMKNKYLEDPYKWAAFVLIK